VKALYFAYGSNLKSTRMLARVPSASPMGAARLTGWRFALDKLSRDGSGKANLSIESHASVWGVVYRIAPEHWTRLDEFEPGYTRTQLDVVAADGSGLRVQTYIADAPAAGLVAFDWYKSLIIDGAREHGLPDDYVSGLQALPARRDPNA